MEGAVNASVDKSRWRMLETDGVHAEASGTSVSLRETVLRSAAGYRIIWYWYDVDGADVSADWQAKLLEAWAMLRHGYSDSKLISVTAESDDPDAARAVLRSFVAEAFHHVRACMSRAGPACAATTA